jgi:hypothetical protein
MAKEPTIIHRKHKKKGLLIEADVSYKERLLLLQMHVQYAA